MGIIYKNGIPYGNQPSIDATLTHQGEAADAKAVGDEISDVRNTLNHKADLIYDTASGDIASFPDGADGLPVKDLTVAIEPVQDLHGYDNPWPAGGGKNLFNPQGYDGVGYNKSVGTTITISESSITVTASDNTLSFSNGSGWNGLAFITPSLTAGTYSFVASITGNNRSSLYVIDSDNIVKSLENSTISGQGYSKTLTVSNGDRIALWVGNTEVSTITLTGAQIEAGSQTTSWVPYSNICPISGWTGANVTRTGKNLLNVTLEQGGFTNHGADTTNDATVRCAGFIDAYPLKGKTLVFSLYPSTLQMAFAVYDGNNPSTNNNVFDTGFQNSGYTFTIPENANAKYYRIIIKKSSGANITPSEVSWVQLELGSTASAYEPYQSTTIPISWQSSAGTVYGGTLDVTSGVLTVTDANIASYNGETLPGEWISDRDVYAAGTTPTTGAQVVYKLAIHQTYQLTATEVITLLGQNNIWADCGPSTVEYPCDTKLYIERLTAPEEDDMIADANIASGKYFIINNNLYLSTAAILAGDPIKPGTNCTLTNLAAALNALNS